MNNATQQRDRAAALAKSNPRDALDIARRIKEPWFRAQALSWVARYSTDKSVGIAKEAAGAARECDDAYKAAAVRSWEIAALAEVGATAEASRALKDAIATSREISPVASRAEALFRLLQAAARIDSDARDSARVALMQACSNDTHWRSKRALRDAERICKGELTPREFFW